MGRAGDVLSRVQLSHESRWFCIVSSLVSVCRCPGLSLYISPIIPIYNAVVFLFVLANFSMATFMDPGIFPRGESCSRLSAAQEVSCQEPTLSMLS